MDYRPGLHLIADIHTDFTEALINTVPVRALLTAKIEAYGLHRIADHFHSFGENSGYTGIICLTESHISMHTWPEFGYLTLDIYLSNHLHVNDGKAEALLNDCLQFFKAKHYKKTALNR